MYKRQVEGNVNKLVKYTTYAVLEDTLARRTYDESGDYTINATDGNNEASTLMRIV